MILGFLKYDILACVGNLRLVIERATTREEGLALSFSLVPCKMCLFWPFFGLPFLSHLLVMVPVIKLL
jgi:hypothetical protein